MIRKEWVALTTFGEIEGNRELREIVEMNVLPRRRGDRVKIEALVVPEISHVQNEHIGIVKRGLSPPAKVVVF